MKELVVISGKGGTGKTSVLASCAALAGRSMIADCDVDAADLHLLLHPQQQSQEEFWAGRLAAIDLARCVHCGLCRDNCRFGAITPSFIVSGLDCEGCGACRLVCPVGAIALEEARAGDWFRGETKYGPMVYARLRPAAENSGKLVAQVRKTARAWAAQAGLELLLTDGPPGIGCPVISSLGNADLALVVTEPTVSGLHDLTRVLDLCTHFRVPALVCINKADLYPPAAQEIGALCRARNVAMTAPIPFDPAASRAIQAGRPLVEYDAGAASQALQAVWAQVQRHLRSSSCSGGASAMRGR
jgi:MinD superfamily P-loop ATPase